MILPASKETKIKLVPDQLLIRAEVLVFPGPRAKLSFMNLTNCPDCGGELKNSIDSWNRPYIYCLSLCGYKVMGSKLAAQPITPQDFLPLKSLCSIGKHNNCLHNPVYLAKLAKLFKNRLNSKVKAKVWDEKIPKPNLVSAPATKNPS